MTDVIVNPSSNIDISVSQASDSAINVSSIASSTSVGFLSTNDGLSSESNLSSAVNELASRFYQLSSAPSGSGINEGDLWYDLSISRLKVYSGSVWDTLGLTDPDLDGRFEFNSADTISGNLTSGNLAQFQNNGVTKFSVDYNGVVKLNELSSTPSNPTDGDLAFISGELYIAK